MVATDNRSTDGTTEILERYAADGVLHLIREDGDDLRQSEWVTRMARMAAADFGADWVVNADADEFWWPEGESLREVLAAVPQYFGVVRGAWRNFVPRPEGDPFFAERMTVRYCAPSFHPHPLSTHSKSAHRAALDVRVGRGNHEAFGEGLVPLRGWYPFEILHFPVRSLEHSRRKYVTQFVALERNAEKGISAHMAAAYRAYLAGDLDSFYAPLVVDDELARGSNPAPTPSTFASGTGCARSGSASEWPRRPPRPNDGTSPRRRASPPSTRRSRRRTPASPSARAWTRSNGGSRRSSGGRSPAFAPRFPDGPREGGLGKRPRVRPRDEPRSSCSWSHWPSSRSRRSGGRWPRAATRGTTSRTTSSSRTGIRRSRTSSLPHAADADRARCPLSLGGTALLEIVFAVLYAAAIVGWSATALTFGRIPALFTAGLLLVYPAYATLYHQASSDAIFATGLALWALLLARTLRTPTGWRFAALGVGMAILVLIRPANEILLPLALVPLLVPVAWGRRIAWSGACLAGAVVLLGAWAVSNGLRYDDYTVARGGRAWVPFLKVFTDDRTISAENGDASRRLAALIETEVLAKPPYKRLRVPSTPTSRTLELRTVRLIAPRTACSVATELRRALRPAPRRSASTPGRIRAEWGTFWQFLVQRPLREGIAPGLRRRRASATTFTSDGVVLPNPQAHVLVAAVPTVRLVRVRLHRLVRCPIPRSSGATRRLRPGTGKSSLRCGNGRRAALAYGRRVRSEILNRITPRFPRPPLWLAVGLIALIVRRPAGWRTIVVLWVGAFLVLVHAASQEWRRVRAPALSGVHRDRAQGARRRPQTCRLASIDG